MLSYAYFSTRKGLGLFQCWSMRVLHSVLLVKQEILDFEPCYENVHRFHIISLVFEYV